MSALTLKTRALAAPPLDLAIMTRVTALAVGAVAAGSVFSAGWALADLVLKAL